MMQAETVVAMQLDRLFIALTALAMLGRGR